MTTITSSPVSSPLQGTITVPGDKSISHRSLMLGAMALGTSKVRGLLEGEDVLATRGALEQMGVTISRNDAGEYSIAGVGVGGLLASEDVLDMGNAGTGARLMMGLVASHPFDSIFTGDASLRSRPMQRVITPLKQMGVAIDAREGNKLPLTVHGTQDILPTSYTLPVASAQVKSCILLAGLNTAGETTVVESVPTRDHTERMLRAMGANITTEEKSDGSHITITGYPTLAPLDIDVPADPSSAAFPLVAALLVPGSALTIENVCMNPARTGLFITLEEMGADIRYSNQRETAGESVADITVTHAPLKGITVPAARAASMIDEYPILSIAASVADGTTHMESLEELRVKESDRLQAVYDGLIALGINAEMTEDSLTIHGNNPAAYTQRSIIQTHLDHRIAMSFLIAGLVVPGGVKIDDGHMINTSFPGFYDLINGLGGDIG